METGEQLVDAFERIAGATHRAVEGLSPECLAFRPDDRANSIAWLVWHLTRIQDDHIAGVAGTEQIWTSQGWHERFALPFDPSDTGYGHSSDEVAAVRVDSGDLLLGYYDAVHDQTIRFVSGLTPQDLDAIVDRAWHPPVSLGVRVVSVIANDLQHVGQAAYVRGLAERRSGSARL
jgi:hypothetical protein